MSDLVGNPEGSFSHDVTRLWISSDSESMCLHAKCLVLPWIAILDWVANIRLIAGPVILAMAVGSVARLVFRCWQV